MVVSLLDKMFDLDIFYKLIKSDVLELYKINLFDF